MLSLELTGDIPINVMEKIKITPRIENKERSENSLIFFAIFEPEKSLNRPSRIPTFILVASFLRYVIPIMAAPTVIINIGNPQITKGRTWSTIFHLQLKPKPFCVL